jgi:hypothetical protein
VIQIDSAAGSSSLLDYAPLSSLATASILPSPPFSDTRADVYFDGYGPSGIVRVGIEVKRLTELVSALDDGRFQATQLPGLMYCYDIRWLLIVTSGTRRSPTSGLLQTSKKVKGDWTWLDWDKPGRTFPYSYVDRFLCSPSFALLRDDTGEGIRYDRVFDYQAAAYWIADLYHEWQKPFSSHSSMRVLDRSGNSGAGGQSPRSLASRLSSESRMRDPTFAHRVRAASGCFPHVSYTRAVALAEHFSSVQEMIAPACTCRDRENASPNDLARMAAEEERIWAEVRTKDQDTGKERRMGKKLAQEWGKAVR